MSRRTKSVRTVDAIFTSDWHLRDDQPVCRTDDMWKAQWKKVKFISDLQKQYDCPVIHAGDLGHKWDWSDYLITMAIRYLPDKFFSIFGQHDLPQHNMTLSYKSGMSTLIEANRITLLDTCHFGQTPDKPSLIIQGRKILVWHQLVWQGERPWPGCKDPTANDVLNEYQQFDTIVTGDNHKTIVVERDGRLLINAGSLMRQTAEQIDHRPCVFLWNAETNTTVQTFLPISENAVSREHIEKKEERDNRIDAFVSRLSGELDIGASFETNLERYAKENNIQPPVMEIVQKAVETKR